jgi:GntR family transcriptional regulator
MSPDLVNRLPFYAQVENVIIGFSNRSLPHGARLPSEDNLVQEYAVSRTSLRTAIQSLVQRGLTPSAQKGGLRK